MFPQEELLFPDSFEQESQTEELQEEELLQPELQQPQFHRFEQELLKQQIPITICSLFFIQVCTISYGNMLKMCVHVLRLHIQQNAAGKEVSLRPGGCAVF